MYIYHWVRKDLQYMLFFKKKTFVLLILSFLFHFWIVKFESLVAKKKKKKLPNSPCHTTDVLSTFSHQQGVYF